MKIICIGRNYAKHAAELQNAVPDQPVIFLKPETAVLPKGEALSIPAFTQDLHYECELVVKIGKTGKAIPAADALDYIDGVTLGIDFTARDVQENLKKKSLPWELAKAFDGSAAIGNFRKMDGLGDLKNVRFTLEKNSETVQSGHTADMLFPVAEILAFASRYFTLQPGDAIFTGTPEGVGPVKSGDVLKGILEGETVFEVSIA